MKRLSIILGILLFCGQGVLANDSAQKVEDNKAVIAVQKQPSNEVQKQKATRNIACIIIQINGKVKDSINSESAR